MINFLFRNAAAITTSDTTNIPNPSQQDGEGNKGCFLYIGASLANIKVLTVGGQEVTIKAPAVGHVLPIQVLRVFTTGSAVVAANDIIALWY